MGHNSGNCVHHDVYVYFNFTEPTKGVFAVLNQAPTILFYSGFGTCCDNTGIKYHTLNIWADETLSSFSFLLLMIVNREKVFHSVKNVHLCLGLISGIQTYLTQYYFSNNSISIFWERKIRRKKNKSNRDILLGLVIVFYCQHCVTLQILQQ